MTKDVSWKLLIATSDEPEASLLKKRLESEGISCRLQVRNIYPEVSHGGKAREFQVYVPGAEFEASQQALEQGELEESDQ
jgi:hypothetical protein